MNVFLEVRCSAHRPRSQRRLCLLFILATITATFCVTWPGSSSLAQGQPGINIGEGDDSITNSEPVGADRQIGSDNTPGDLANGEFSLLSLMLKGGPLMIPILLMSVLVVMLVIERSLSLRLRKVLPRQLVRELGELSSNRRGFDPRKAYRICQRYPSAASTVIRTMLLKVGRPQSEVERAVAEASEREASRLYGNVRWLNLAAAVTPLMGLFGTVWGMIRAFFDTTQLQAGQNKADFLAEGIYVALVTTLGGLAVAIPAAIFSHYFEGRIQNLFYRIDELLFSLLPQIEKYEGQLRVNHKSLSGTTDDLELGTAKREDAKKPAPAK